VIFKNSLSAVVDLELWEWRTQGLVTRCQLFICVSELGWSWSHVYKAMYENLCFLPSLFSLFRN